MISKFSRPRLNTKMIIFIDIINAAREFFQMTIANPADDRPTSQKMASAALGYGEQ